MVVAELAGSFSFVLLRSVAPAPLADTSSRQPTQTPTMFIPVWTVHVKGGIITASATDPSVVGGHGNVIKATYNATSCTAKVFVDNKQVAAATLEGGPSMCAAGGALATDASEPPIMFGVGSKSSSHFASSGETSFTSSPSASASSFASSASTSASSVLLDSIGGAGASAGAGAGAGAGDSVGTGDTGSPADVSGWFRGALEEIYLKNVSTEDRQAYIYTDNVRPNPAEKVYLFDLNRDSGRDYFATQMSNVLNTEGVGFDTTQWDGR
jgi:hypothetical protein